jgi:hypothetical protein
MYRIHWMPLAAVSTLMLARVTACGGGGSDACTTADALDPDVAPVLSGSWERPTLDTAWQIQLTGDLDFGYPVELFDLDLFDTAQADIDRLHSDGVQVICYFSAGSAEVWREDYDQFDDCALGNAMVGWAGVYWLDIRAQNVVDIMLARLDLAVEKGCDGVDPDNVNGYTVNTGFDLTADDQLAYNKLLANEAHQRGLSVGLKNDNYQVNDLVDYYDFMVNEECHNYDECQPLYVFLNNDRPIFNIEYADTYSQGQELAKTLCPVARAENMRTLIMPLELDGSWRISCDE